MSETLTYKPMITVTFFGATLLSKENQLHQLILIDKHIHTNFDETLESYSYLKQHNGFEVIGDGNKTYRMLLSGLLL